VQEWIHQPKHKIRRIILYGQSFVGITFKSSVFFLHITRTLKNSTYSFLFNTIVGYILWIPSSSLSLSHSIPANILTFFPYMHVVNLPDYTPSFTSWHSMTTLSRTTVPCMLIRGRSQTVLPLVYATQNGMAINHASDGYSKNYAYGTSISQSITSSLVYRNSL